MIPYLGALMDAEAFVASSQKARARFDGLIHRALERTVEVAASFAKLSPLYRSHTYGLRSSIKGIVIGGFGGVAGAGLPAGRVLASAPYAKFVEDGTAPHLIMPRRKKVLRFIQNGEVRFARGVFHPGTEPRPFLKDAAARTAPIFERLVKEAFVRAFL